MNPVHSPRHTLPLLLSGLLLLITNAPARAGSATWNLNPTSGDWNTAANWMPGTVPNGLSDTATFGTSDVTNLSINTTAVEVSSMVFDSGAALFTITVDSTNLVLSGTGVVNNSGVVQSVINVPNGAIFFSNNATAGNTTFFGGTFFFFTESASAGSASFAVSSVGIFQGAITFFDNSTAAEATIAISDFAYASFGDTATAANAVFTATAGGAVLFGTNSTAENAVVTCSGAPGTLGSGIGFNQSATAAQGRFIAEGAATSSDSGGYIDFSDSTTAANASFGIDGGSAQNAPGAVMTFFSDSTAGNATLTANGGVNGGEGGAILFDSRSLGGTASITLLDNGELDIGNSRLTPGVTIGSLAGNGLVFLGPKTLTTGSNNQSTTFSGVIQDGGDNHGTGGSVRKIGTGTLTLSGANTYTGVTTVSAGVLKVSNPTGSATGTGAVKINAGTLGGKGILASAVTVGTGSGAGAFLAPGVGASQPTKLTIQSLLDFKADGTYTYKLSTKKAKADQVVANGVTIESGAQFNFGAVSNKKLTAGTVFTALSNTSATPISGTFANLADGSTFTAGLNTFQVSYSGGDGNDLTLTVVP